MELVSEETIEAYLEKYERARGGLSNEDTDSEAMFVMVGKYRGIYVLTTGLGPVWIGLQNATARWSRGGKPYASVRDALQVAIADHKHPTAVEIELYYSEDAVERLHWIADRITSFKALGHFLFYT